MKVLSARRNDRQRRKRQGDVLFQKTLMIQERKRRVQDKISGVVKRLIYPQIELPSEAISILKSQSERRSKKLIRIALLLDLS